MDFYDRIGAASLGSRLRRLGDRLAEDGKPIYALYGTELQPRWFPVIYLLSRQGQTSIIAIADAIGHTHASVSQIVSEMLKHGYVRAKKDQKDGRKTFVALSAKGRSASKKLDIQCVDVAAAVQSLQTEAEADLWTAVAKVERALAQQNFYHRVMREKFQREIGVEVVEYAQRYAKTFRSLNEDWITKHFKIEEADRRVLDDPEEYILRPGGQILIALLNGKPVGTCAVIRQGEHSFELAKMAVATNARGKGIGYLLGESAIQWAASAGAQTLYLESNTKLKPAVELYRKLGFREVSGHSSPFERCNIQMERSL